VATKSDFTEDEWKTLQKGVTGAGMLVSVSDRDFTDSFGEASALAKYLGGQRQSGATELVRELAAVKGTGFGLTDSPQEVETETLEALQTAKALLGAKAPEELGPYRELVLGTANHVAEAKGGVSDVETATISKLEAALGGS
jgi:tellurite resistance protein